jgi:putative FmdB family regulatory protein
MIYEYICDAPACLHIFEKVLRMADIAVPVSEPCPSCGVKGHVRRYIGTATPWVDESVAIGHHRKLGDFKHVLERIHKSNYRSNLNSCY